MLFPLLKRKVIRGFQDHINAGLGGATDYVAKTGSEIYSPFYGTIYHFQEAKGGNWIGIRGNDGLHFEFAHLSKYIAPHQSPCLPGQVIALSGNTGTETTGEHVHHQIIKNGQRIDPEEFYTAQNIPVVAINGSINDLQAIQQKILEFSQGMLTISWDIIDYPISIQQGMMTQSAAYDIARKLYNERYEPYRYLFMFYQGNDTSSFLETYYDPLKRCISTVPLPCDARLSSFEFSHQIQTWYNANREELPHIEVVDSNFPTDDLIISKYRSVLAYTDILLKANE